MTSLEDRMLENRRVLAELIALEDRLRQSMTDALQRRRRLRIVGDSLALLALAVAAAALMVAAHAADLMGGLQAAP